MADAVLSATDAVALYDLARRDGVRLWIVGGWGVDALLGHQTRPHHDLDVLVDVDDLSRFYRAMETSGFRRAFVWDDENIWLETDDGRWPSAFVLEDADGRQLDVHVVDVSARGAVVMGIVPWVFPRDALEGVGSI